MIKQEIVIEHDVFPMGFKGPITVATCSRRTGELQGNVIVRKFKSECGNILEVHQTIKNGTIRSIRPLYGCIRNCAACADRTAKIRKLIAAENQSR